MAVAEKALGEGPGGGASALVPPVYMNGVQSQCPKCGHAPVYKSGKCSNCGYTQEAKGGRVGEEGPEKEFRVDFDMKAVAEDPETGTLIIEGYGSTWIEDRDEESVVKSAFSESLDEFMHNPVVLLDHDKHKPIGTVKDAWTDAIGLFIRAEIPKPTKDSEAWHHKAYSDIKRGVRKAFSIGGKFIRDSTRKFITKVHLYELSVIAIPANPTSLFAVVGIKEWAAKTASTGVGRGHGAHHRGPVGHAGPRLRHRHANGIRHRHRVPRGSGFHAHRRKDFAYEDLKGAFEQFVIEDAEDGNDMLDLEAEADLEGLGVEGLDEKTVDAELEFETKGGKMATETDKKEVIEVNAKEWETTQLTIKALADEKDARDKTAAIEAEAKSRFEQEQKDKVEADKKEVERKKEINDAVEEQLKALRAGATSGRKHVWSGDGKASGQKDYRLSAYMLDLVRAKKGDFDAFKRLKDKDDEAANSYKEAGYEVKAYGEGANVSGGFLVPPQFLQSGIAEFRIAQAKVRQLCTIIRGVNSNSVLIPRETGISSTGWTAENAAKPSTDATFGQISVGVYTLAGIAKVSRQLLEDSTPAVDMIVRRALGKSLGQQEDLAFINGTGTGMPTGVLGTAGILTGTVGTKLWSSIAGAIATIQSNYFGNPTAILAHPRDVNTLRTTADTAGRPIFLPNYWAGANPMSGGSPAFLGPNAVNEQGQQFPMAIAPDGYVFGLPVYSDANIPTNLGGGTNESRMIIAAWDEAYIFDRVGMNMDVSSEAGTSFEQNQIWFRAEERVGFTAARQPSAFYVMTGLVPGAGL